MEDRETYLAELQQTVLVKLEIPLTVLFNCDNYWIISHYPPPQTASLKNNDDLDNYYSDAQPDQSQTFPPTSNLYTTNYDTAMSDTRDVTARKWDEDDVIREEPTECGFDEELEESRRKSNIWRWKQVLKQKGFRRIQAELNSVGEGEGQLEVTPCSHVLSNDRLRLKSKRLQGKGKQSSHRATDSLRTNALNKEFSVVATSSPLVDRCCQSSGDEYRTLSTPFLFDSVPGTKPNRSLVDEGINAATIYSEGIRKKSSLRPSSADGPRVIPEALGMNGMRMSPASNGHRVSNGYGLRHSASKKLVHSQSTDAWDVGVPGELVPGWEAKVNSLDCPYEYVEDSRSLNERDRLMQDERPTSVPPPGGRTSKTPPETRDGAALVPDECDTQHCTTKQTVLNSDFLMKCKTVDFDSACIANAASNAEKRFHVHSTSSSSRSKNTKTRNNGGSCVQASNKQIKYVINDFIVDAIKDVLNDVIKATKSESIICPSNLVLYRSEFRPNPAAKLVSSSTTTVSKQDWLKSRSLPASLKSDAMNGCDANVLHYHHGDTYSQLVETVPTTYVIAEGHLRSLNIYGLGSATRVSPPRHSPSQRGPPRAMNEVKALTTRLHLLPVGKSDTSTLVNGRYNIAVALDLSVRRNSETVVPLMSQGYFSSHRMHGTLNHADSTDSGVESETCRGLDKVIADIAADIVSVYIECWALKKKN